MGTSIYLRLCLTCASKSEAYSEFLTYVSKNTGFAPPVVLCWRETSSHITLASPTQDWKRTPLPSLSTADFLYAPVYACVYVLESSQ